MKKIYKHNLRYDSPFLLELDTEKLEFIDGLAIVKFERPTKVWNYSSLLGGFIEMKTTVTGIFDENLNPVLIPHEEYVDIENFGQGNFIASYNVICGDGEQIHYSKHYSHLIITDNAVETVRRFGKVNYSRVNAINVSINNQIYDVISGTFEGELSEKDIAKKELTINKN